MSHVVCRAALAYFLNYNHGKHITQKQDHNKKVSYSVSHVERKALSLPGQAPQKSPT